MRKQIAKLEIEGKPNNFVVVELYYSKGGVNYFTYKTEPRGYYLSAQPTEIEVGDGFTCKKFTAFTGIKMLVLEVKRQSKGQAAQAEVMADDKLNDLVYAVCQKNNIQIASEEYEACDTPQSMGHVSRQGVA